MKVEVCAMKRILCLLMLWSLVAMPSPAARAARAGSVEVLPVTGGIDPAVADFLTEGLREANAPRNGRRDTSLVVIQMDTPGGLSDAMDRIVQGILASKTPVCVYVAPAGARAASAGAIIALAANVVAMAPATNMGAATPIEGITGGDLGRKIKNDAAARARALAALRGRPADWAERVVLRAESVTVDEALKQGLADVKATDMPDLFRQLDGRKISGQVLHLAGAPVRTREMPFGLALLHLLANPNVAYLLLLVAIYGLIAELSHPGAVFPGVAGSICGLLAFYGLSVLSVNVTGLLLILLAVGPPAPRPCSNRGGGAICVQPNPSAAMRMPLPASGSSTCSTTPTRPATSSSGRNASTSRSTTASWACGKRWSTSTP
jgi:membrane-bound serine protease (ClpP class)